MKQSPHIVLITCDELRQDALSCYGNQVIQTPNLDRLAGQAIQFRQAYTVSPWCLPARCAMLTGLYPHHSGAYSNFRPCALNQGIPNIFTTLKQHHYQTALIGKCHFTPVPYSLTRPDTTLPYEKEREYYLSLGIDHLDLQDDKQVSAWFYDDYAKELEQAGYLEAYRDAVWNRAYHKVFPFPGPEEWHPDSWVGRKAVEYVADCDANTSQCLWISFSGPHYPFDPPEVFLSDVDEKLLKQEVLHVREGEFSDPSRIHYNSYHGGPGEGIDGQPRDQAQKGGCKQYSDEYWLRLRKHYYANMLQIDHYVGQILEMVERKFGEQVLVIFTADHGEMLGHHHLWGKHNCAYEDVWKIPLLVSYPDQQQAEQSNAKVMNLDIAATIFRTVGINDVPTDGIDFRENMEQDGYQYVFAEGEGYIATRDERIKYVHIAKEDKGNYKQELLDLVEDPQEFSDVSRDPQYQPELARMREVVINHFMKGVLP